MSDFYSDSITPPTPLVLVPRFGPPPRITRGPDGIPDYVEATAGSPYQYIAPPGKRLAIYHNGVRIKQIVVADRQRGFAVGLHYRENKDWTITHLSHDENGVSQHRFYEGVIAFELIYAAGRYTPPELRKTHGKYSIYG